MDCVCGCLRVCVCMCVSACVCVCVCVSVCVCQVLIDEYSLCFSGCFLPESPQVQPLVAKENTNEETTEEEEEKDTDVLKRDIVAVSVSCLSWQATVAVHPSVCWSCLSVCPVMYPFSLSLSILSFCLIL